jgi:hypothetical protein
MPYPQLGSCFDWLIPVIGSITSATSTFVPTTFHSRSMNMTWGGAMSSCNVHPLFHHLQFRKAGSLSACLPSGRSERNAKQTLEFLYQRNMELMASESSALDDLSMQQVSTQIYVVTVILRHLACSENFVEVRSYSST